jgi:hypothetical protein
VLDANRDRSIPDAGNSVLTVTPNSLTTASSNGAKIPPMKHLLGLAGLILAVMTASLVGQEVKHAPTFQACDADLNLWSSQIRGFPTSTREQDQDSTKSLTVVEMTNRMSYLGDCSQAYPVFSKSRPGELSVLASLCLVYQQEMQGRLLHFLSRHDLTAKFYEEDEGGKR